MVCFFGGGAIVYYLFLRVEESTKIKCKKADRPIASITTHLLDFRCVASFGYQSASNLTLVKVEVKFLTLN